MEKPRIPARDPDFVGGFVEKRGENCGFAGLICGDRTEVL